MPDELWQAFKLSLVTAAVAFTVAETKLFAPLREATDRKAPLLGSLLSCGYCLGHWVALALVIAYRPRLFQWWGPLDYSATFLAVAWMSALQWGLLCVMVEKAGK